MPRPWPKAIVVRKVDIVKRVAYGDRMTKTHERYSNMS